MWGENVGKGVKGERGKVVVKMKEEGGVRRKRKKSGRERWGRKKW